VKVKGDVPFQRIPGEILYILLLPLLNSIIEPSVPTAAVCPNLVVTPKLIWARQLVVTPGPACPAEPKRSSNNNNNSSNSSSLHQHHAPQEPRSPGIILWVNKTSVRLVNPPPAIHSKFI
jgi:hypothetical protein